MNKLHCLSLICCLALTTFTSTRLHAADVVLDSIVAVVNEGVVLASELNTEVAFLKLQAQGSGQNLPDDAVFNKRVLERLINQEIQRQHANKVGVAIDAASVNRAIEQVANGNNMDTQQFRQALVSQGFDYDHYRTSIEHELLLSRLVQRDVQSRIRISKQEVEDYISASKKSGQQQRYRAQHILLAVAPSAAQATVSQAEARAAALLSKLRAGDDFAKAAAANSDGARALEGGDLGWRVLQELPDFLSEVLVNMSVGDISEPLRSQNGFHIVKLTDKSDQSREVRAETLARHIFVTGETADGAQLLAQVRARIKTGESFEAMAKEFSEDPNSSSAGGELPWFSQGQMPEEIESIAQTLDKGDLSEPFRTQYGWHLLEVLDRRQRDSTDESVRAEAEKSLRQRKIEQETERWIRELRDESFVEVRE